MSAPREIARKRALVCIETVLRARYVCIAHDGGREREDRARWFARDVLSVTWRVTRNSNENAGTGVRGFSPFARDSYVATAMKLFRAARPPSLRYRVSHHLPVRPRFSRARFFIYRAPGLPFRPTVSLREPLTGNGEQSVSRDTVENKDRVRRVRNAIGWGRRNFMRPPEKRRGYASARMPMIIAFYTRGSPELKARRGSCFFFLYFLFYFFFLFWYRLIYELQKFNRAAKDERTARK